MADNNKGGAKEVCRAFRNNNGECRFGAECKYEHSKGDPIAVPARDFKPKGDCHSWEKEKKCKFGDRCRFLHGSEDKRETYRPPRPANTSGEQEICRQYERRGKCRYGDKCKHKHVEGAKKERKEAAKGESKKNGESAKAGGGRKRRRRGGAGGGSGGAGGGSGGEKKQVERQYDKDGMEICRRFKEGKCKFGAECTYSHGAVDPKAQPKPGSENKSGGGGGGRQRRRRAPASGGGSAGGGGAGLCHEFSESGKCEYGSECRFKHGEGDKRDLGLLRKKQRGVCYQWQEGTCEYGDECRFLHQNE